MLRVYPEVDQDSAAAHDPMLRADEPFQLLEMAHFETVESVDDFKQEFNGYLAPGIMKGPDLAVEVARLEGLPVEWKTLEEDDRKAFQESHVALTYEAADRQVYNPDAEREARLAAEGHTYEPTQPMIEHQCIKKMSRSILTSSVMKT